MEELYLRGSQNTPVTEQIHLRTYFNNFKDDTVESFPNCTSTPEDVAACMGITFTKEELDTLSNNCSSELLTVEGEMEQLDTVKECKKPNLFEKTSVPEDTKLETLKMLTKRSKLDDLFLYKRMKYRNQMQLADGAAKFEYMKPGSDFLISVRVHHPFKYEVYCKIRNISSCHQEIILLGCQTLDKLCDVLICMEEFGDVDGDISENPDSLPGLRNNEVYKSSMCFIGNCFYIDTRRPENLDYSEVVRTWAAKRKINVNRVEKMETTKIEDLVVRFGYPYVYQHLGNCEHLLIFSDARLIHSEDILNRNQYPLCKSFSNKVAKFCVICASNVAKWIVEDCKILTQDPAYLCEICFKLYLYKEKMKICSFKAYRYYDRRALL